MGSINRVLRSVLVVLVVSQFISLQSWAGWEERSWQKIIVPGAVCGKGGEYPVFINKRDPKKIVLEFKGGGACWDWISCYSKIKTTSLGTPGRVIDKEGLISGNPKYSPVTDYTFVYFPYCTGDVHMGASVKKYRGRATYHYGRSNIERAVDHLVKSGEIDLATAERVLIYGYSAGALGALYHINTIAPYVNPAADKALLADAPGLHFGKVFWKKFPSVLLNDYARALDTFGLKLNKKNGNIASLVPKLCRRFPDWRVGVMQGSQDLVMSFFGTTLPLAQHIATFGKNGLYELTKDPNDNCSAWVPAVGMHTFLAKNLSLRSIWAQRVRAIDYAEDMVLGLDGAFRNYDGRR